VQGIEEIIGVALVDRQEVLVQSGSPLLLVLRQVGQRERERSCMRGKQTLEQVEIDGLKKASVGELLDALGHGHLVAALSTRVLVDRGAADQRF
jgi:hypothetical protein